MNRQFLNKFRKLEQFVRRVEGKDNESLSQTINESRHPFVVDNRAALDTLNRIRNVFAHNETINYLEVNEKAIHLLDHLLATLPTEAEAFELMTKNVISFQIDEPLINALKSIENTNIHQYPILKGKVVQGMLTDNGIANWLAKNMNNQEINIQDTPISEVLKNDEKSGKYLYIPKNMPYGQILDLYEADPKLKTILVTETGKKHQAILGIITPYDLLF